MQNYYLNIIQSFLFSKYNLNVNFLNFLQNVTISIFTKDVKNFFDIKIFKAFIFLQSISHEKPKISYQSYFEKKKKIMAARCFVILKNRMLFDFLKYFASQFLYFFKKKNYYFLNCFIKKEFSNFSFSVSDVSLFNFLPAHYYDWVSTVVFSFNFCQNSIINKLNSFFFLSYLSCFLVPLNVTFEKK